jgi:hypothetical protein
MRPSEREGRVRVQKKGMERFRNGAAMARLNAIRFHSWPCATTWPATPELIGDCLELKIDFSGA